MRTILILIALSLITNGWSSNAPKTGESSFSTEVEVLETTVVPSALRSPYPTAIRVISARRVDSEEDNSSVLYLAGLAFEDRKIRPFGLLEPGTIITVNITPWEMAPASVKTIMMLDEVSGIGADLHFVTTFESENGNSEAEPTRGRMKLEEEPAEYTEYLRSVLRTREGRFWGGEDGFHFYIGSGRIYEENFWEAKDPGYFELFTKFSDKLESRGIELCILIAPCSATTMPGLATQSRYNFEEHGLVNSSVEEFSKRLNKHGVRTVSVTEHFVKKPFFYHDGQQYPLQHRVNQHWSSMGARIAAHAMATKTKGLIPPPRPTLDKPHFTISPVITDAPGFFVARTGHVRTPIPIDPTVDFCLVPKNSSAEQLLVKDDPKSRIQLIGDSYSGHLSDSDAGIHAYLVNQFREPVYLDSVSSSPERTSIRWLTSEASSHCKLLLWVLAERAL